MIRYVRIETPSPQPRRCGPSLVDRMAEDMREMAFAGETVNVETLGQRGYSAAVVKRLAAKATAVARRRSIRQIAVD